MRHVPDPLRFDDAGRAAHALARLPDTDGGALAALAWASVNARRALCEMDEGGVRCTLSQAASCMIEIAEAVPAPGARSRAVWRALSHIATALAGEGDDPSGGATHFHHGASAPDWALDNEPSRWIGSWAFYGGEGPKGATA